MYIQISCQSVALNGQMLMIKFKVLHFGNTCKLNSLRRITLVVSVALTQKTILWKFPDERQHC